MTRSRGRAAAVVWVHGPRALTRSASKIDFGAADPAGMLIVDRNDEGDVLSATIPGTEARRWTNGTRDTASVALHTRAGEPAGAVYDAQAAS